MADIHIRSAVKEDCGRLLELVRELALFEHAPEKVTVTPQHFIESGFGASPVWWAFVAITESEGKELIVGFALYYIRFSTWKGQRIYLEDLFVTNDYRGKGTGKLLFERMIEEMKEKQFNGITWQVLEWNEPAINFYKKYGAELDAEWVNGEISL